MSEDTENNIVNLSEYREKRQREEEAKKEQESFFNDDYPSIFPSDTNIKTTHIRVDGTTFSIEDLMTPAESEDMVNTIMHMIKLLDERDRIAESLKEHTDNSNTEDKEGDE